MAHFPSTSIIKKPQIDLWFLSTWIAYSAHPVFPGVAAPPIPSTSQTGDRKPILDTQWKTKLREPTQVKC